MSSVVGHTTELVLNSILLGLFVAVLVFGGFRLLLAYRQGKKFLIVFFSVTCLIALFECAIQMYQVIELALGKELVLTYGIALNTYTMIFEAAALFLIADFWGDTSEILTKQST